MPKIPIIGENGKIILAQLLGHSRSEKPMPEGAVRVLIPATVYTEKDVEFLVPQGMGIEAMLVISENFPSSDNRGVFIRTRPATKEELKRCHHPRHPVLVKTNEL